MADNRHSRRLKLLQPLLALPIPLPFARAFDLPIPNCPDVTFPALEFKVRFPNACAFPLLHSDPCPEITNPFTLGSFHSSFPSLSPTKPARSLALKMASEDIASASPDRELPLYISTKASVRREYVL